MPIDAFEKLKIESEYVKYNNGANINYSEIGMVKNNPNTIIELIKYGNELGIEYQGFNVRNDKCLKCDVFNLCKGGCPYTNKFNKYCEFQYIVCKHIMDMDFRNIQLCWDKNRTFK